MTAAYHHTGFFSIKNPTIESEVSWSSLLSFYTLEEHSFQQSLTTLNPSWGALKSGGLSITTL